MTLDVWHVASSMKRLSCHPIHKRLPIKLFRDEGDRNDRRNPTLLLRSDAFWSHVFKAMNNDSATFALGDLHMRMRLQLRFVRTYCLLLQRYSFRETLVPVRHTTRCAITQNMTNIEMLYFCYSPWSLTLWTCHLIQFIQNTKNCWYFKSQAV